MKLKRLKLDNKFRRVFATELVDTVQSFAEATVVFCDFLIRLIDSDIHAVELESLFDKDVLAFQNDPSVVQFQKNEPNSLINHQIVESAWLRHYTQRTYFFLRTISFDGRNLDRKTRQQFTVELRKRSSLGSNTVVEAILEAKNQMTIFFSKARSDDWYYDIDSVLGEIESSLIRTVRPNTLPLFITIMKALEPKFMDDLNHNVGRRMAMSLILRKNQS